jgi:hypothetical protein
MNKSIDSIVAERCERQNHAVSLLPEHLMLKRQANHEVISGLDTIHSAKYSPGRYDNHIESHTVDVSIAWLFTSSLLNQTFCLTLGMAHLESCSEECGFDGHTYRRSFFLYAHDADGCVRSISSTVRTPKGR